MGVPLGDGDVGGLANIHFVGDWLNGDHGGWDLGQDLGWGLFLFGQGGDGGGGNSSWTDDVLKRVRQFFTGNPCPTSNVGKLDYTTPRDYANGLDTPINHITTNHILPSPGKSQYIFQSNTSTIPDQQQAVITFNKDVFLFGSATIQGNGNIAYNLFVPPLPSGGQWYAGIGTVGGQLSFRGTLILGPDCKSVVTSFPGQPGGNP